MTFDFKQHIEKQSEFSERTFGPGPRTRGVIDHIRKELKEIEEHPADLEEWIDVIILAIDGAWRLGATPDQIIECLSAKLEKNMNRRWPNWRMSDQDKAIEHLEDSNEASQAPDRKE